MFFHSSNSSGPWYTLLVLVLVLVLVVVVVVVLLLHAAAPHR
eukprot:SAG25_NODE_702_length_5870_cov_4.999653_3_plen_42_part_00